MSWWGGGGGGGGDESRANTSTDWNEIIKMETSHLLSLSHTHTHSPCRSRTDPVVAIPPRSPPLPRQTTHDPVDGQRIRIQDPTTRGDRKALGRT